MTHVTKQIKDAESVACSAHERLRMPICAGHVRHRVPGAFSQAAGGPLRKRSQRPAAIERVVIA